MDRKELEELWRSRVVEAKLRSDYARNRTNAVVRDFTLDDTSAGGRYAFRSAIRFENDALAELHRLLRIYADLIHDGGVPDEDDWRRNGVGRSGRTD